MWCREETFEIRLNFAFEKKVWFLWWLHSVILWVSITYFGLLHRLQQHSTVLWAIFMRLISIHFLIRMYLFLCWEYSGCIDLFETKVVLFLRGRRSLWSQREKIGYYLFPRSSNRTKREVGTSIVYVIHNSWCPRFTPHYFTQVVEVLWQP